MHSVTFNTMIRQWILSVIVGNKYVSAEKQLNSGFPVSFKKKKLQVV